MRQYNVEIFSPKFLYRDSFQIGSIKYKYDYTDVEKNTIESPIDTKASVADYIRVHSQGNDILGIISDIKTDKGKREIEFKPFHKYFDVDVYTPSMEGNVEQILADLIKAEYVENSDTYQNLEGLAVETTTTTQGTFGFDVGINNLYDMVLDAFTSYQIVCNFVLDVMRKKLTIKIGKVANNPFTIESDMNNIIEREITIKESKEFVNKITVYDSADFTRSVVYYMHTDGTISDSQTSRLLPVFETSKAVDVKTTTDKDTGEETDDFDAKALARATSTLKAPKYTNLIEITTASDDALVRPSERYMGQEVNVISEGNSYNSILTGFEVDEGEFKLIFGIYREQLSKMLKKRWRSSNGN